MSVFPCLLWVPLLWEQLRRLCIQSQTVDPVDLPCEIIADIVSRLPAECAYLCGQSCKPLLTLTTSPSFIRVHLSRATPVIAFQYYFAHPRRVKNGVKEINVSFTDEAAKIIVTKSFKIDILPVPHNTTSHMYLYGSYNGFLLFKNLKFDSLLLIWNPSTQERVSVIAPNTRYRVCGFFFHATSKEYRVLYASWKDECKFLHYFLLSLKTKSTRFINSFSHPPSGMKNHIILNDVLHWMISDEAYDRVHGSYPYCSESIMLFNMNTEEFSTMSHPGGVCLDRNQLQLRVKHLTMSLTVKEGLLCLCDASISGEISIWILDDYENQVWVKMHVIVEPLKMFRKVKNNTETAMKVVGLLMCKDEILLSVIWKNLYLYNRQQDTVKRVGKNSSEFGVSAVCHVNTLAALHADNIIYLFPQESVV